MFLENSRYYKTPTVETTARDGRAVTALKLRPLPPRTGEAYAVKDNDQLDVLAHQQYSDGTKFWHIADANTELEAAKLIAEAGAVINKPAT
jgi:hypothetical protein